MNFADFFLSFTKDTLLDLAAGLHFLTQNNPRDFEA
jgi:hypothetical protein